MGVSAIAHIWPVQDVLLNAAQEMVGTSCAGLKEMTSGAGEGFDFDPKVLADPDADPIIRDRAWRLMYDHFDPRLRSFFKHRTQSDDDLDTLLSEIWRRALLKIGTLSSARAAWSWLVTVGINLLHDQRRDQAASARRQEHFEIYMRENPEESILTRLAEDPFDGRVDRTVFRERLERLSDLDRKLVTLFAVEELSHKAIASQLGLSSAEASRQRLTQIRKALRGE